MSHALHDNETLDSPADLVRRAAEGDRAAWDQIVDRYIGLVWSITREHRLSDADAADVVQTTWLRLVEHLHRLHDPAHVGAWLATTARRECLRAISARKRFVAIADDLAGSWPDESLPEPVAGLIAEETATEVQVLLLQLPTRWRKLMEVLMQDDPPSYEEISRTMGIPIGSIGPTRGRSLDRLRRLMTA